ncbi:MAG: DUF5422 family protein [Chlamydiales bacterium]
MTDGLKLFSDFCDPISWGLERSKTAQKYNCICKSACLPFNGMVIGLIKPLLAPIIAAIGLVVFPIMAVIRALQGREADTKAHFQAFFVSIIVIAAVVGFVMISGNYLKLKTSLGVVSAVMAASVAFHVYRTASALTPKPSH